MLRKIAQIIINFIFPPKFFEEDFIDFKKASPPYHNFINSLYSYKDNMVREVILHLKRNRDRNLAKICAKNVFHILIKNKIDLEKYWMLIPTPIDKEHFKIRGFNQTDLLAKALEKYSEKFKFRNDLVIKRYSTKKQSLVKNRNKRMNNIKGSMMTKNNEDIILKRFIIIDDVTTTGATLLEAKRVLEKAGAREIIAFTLAH